MLVNGRDVHKSYTFYVESQKEGEEMLNNIDKMKELLLYQEIESVKGDTLKLKNGTTIELYEEDYD